MSRPPFPSVDDVDIRSVSQQLGRPARDVVGIAARCVCGNPTVVATRPRLSDGTPFPTFYYLTHPAATAAISTLEAEHRMSELTQLLTDDEDLRSAYREAHEAYLSDRESVLAVPEIEGVSAGGMPSRIKCLHALAAQALACGPGINPIGDIALEEADWSPRRCACVDPRRATDPDTGSPTRPGSGG